MNTVIDIEALANWSAEKEVQTKRGPRLLRKAKPDETFWLAWAESKQDLQAAGISVSKDLESGSWAALWWRELPKEEQERRVKSIEDSRAVSADFKVPSPEGLAYLPFQLAGIRFCLRVFGDKC